MRPVEFSIARIVPIAILVIAAGISCHETTGPETAGPETDNPSTSAPGTAFLWVMVVEESGVCIPGATVTVVTGQRAGVSVTQKTPCDAWAYDGGVLFENLTAGVEMTLQATAPGYLVQEKKIVPTSGAQTAFLFTPSPNN